MSEGGGFAGRTGMYFIDLCKGNPKLTEHARCIKARYDSGIGNRSADIAMQEVLIGAVYIVFSAVFPAGAARSKV